MTRLDPIINIVIDYCPTGIRSPRRHRLRTLALNTCRNKRRLPSHLIVFQRDKLSVVDIRLVRMQIVFRTVLFSANSTFR